MQNNALIPELMAIVNITHNSFSDARQFMQIDEENRSVISDFSEGNPEKIAYSKIVEFCELAISQGATILDIGGESASPGVPRTAEKIERQRVMPVVKKLGSQYRLSIDTMRSAIAREALNYGASIINDVSGGLADPMMKLVIAEYPDCCWIISHWAPLPHTNWLSDMKQHFDSLIDQALSCGVQETQIILDPGIGFAKNAEQNWDILHAVQELKNWGFPLLLGASRKRFLRPFGELAQDRDIATAVITALISQYHPWGIRVHNVEMNRIAMEIAHNFTLPDR